VAWQTTELLDLAAAVGAPRQVGRECFGLVGLQLAEHVGGDLDVRTGRLSHLTSCSASAALQ
jgi:hypothetical protein